MIKDTKVNKDIFNDAKKSIHDSFKLLEKSLANMKKTEKNLDDAKKNLHLLQENRKKQKISIKALFGIQSINEAMNKLTEEYVTIVLENEIIFLNK